MIALEPLFFKLLFDNSCSYCGISPVGENGFLCERCIYSISPKLREISGFRYLDRAFIFAPYKGVAKKLVQLIKFQGARKLIPYLEEIVEPSFLRVIDSLGPEYVTFVPTHPFRILFVRGFDQTEELLKTLYPNHVKIFGRRWIPKRPLSLVGSASKRKKHIKEDFYISFQYIELLKNKRVLIIDDILTTGSTGETLAYLLKSVGVKQVFLFTIFGKV